MSAAAELLRCAGCGRQRHPPVIVHDRSKAPPRVVLVPVFGWHQDARPAFLCGPCKMAYRARRRRKP